MTTMPPTTVNVAPAKIYHLFFQSHSLTSFAVSDICKWYKLTLVGRHVILCNCKNAHGHMLAYTAVMTQSDTNFLVKTGEGGKMYKQESSPGRHICTHN